MTDGIGRRGFLQTGAAAIGGAALGAGGHLAWQTATRSPAAAADAVGRAVEPFRGEHQHGVDTVPQSFAAWLAFDLLPGVDREALVRLMRIWTDDIERLTAGRPGLTDTEPELAMTPARLTVTVAYGPGLLSAAGRDDLAPPWLAPLPPFSIDRLEDRWSGGDVVLQVCADDTLAIAHAGRLLTTQAATFVRPRWTQQGFRASPGATAPGTTMRNLMGQVDGTRNLDPVADADLLWCGADAPEWLVGGTSMVVRRIAMDLDGWDLVDRTGREFTIGRRLSDGSPLTGVDEHDEPDLGATDELGLPVIDMAAHLRRARTEDPDARFLRRGYNFHDPGEPDGRSSGLVFVTFQRDVLTQYLPVQRSLDRLDLLNTWTTPVGSAVLAVPAGPLDGEFLGERLLG
ncbi:Dyp-type peroxidase [Actinotalea sp.]|uniref:Dyp-type peroxidase n=1 Tax=Actinotalea sp. TaxID=1872145 RepID=UPI0035640006